MATHEVDVVVIGLGPGGEHAAQRLAKEGLDVVGVDMHLVGGECPYYGCIPTKSMVRAASALAEARRVPELAGTADVTPDWAVLARHIAGDVTSGWDDTAAVERLQRAGARVVHGRARLDGPGRVIVDDDVYLARRGVIADPGTAPSQPPIDGLAEAGFWTNRDAVRLTELPESLVVIGGGAIGCELAQAIGRFGTRVTMLEMGPHLLGPEEPESGALIAEVFRREGIEVRTGVRIERVERDDHGVTVRLFDGQVQAAEILLAAGRTPNLEGLGLETAGVEVGRSVAVDERMRAADGLWVIGDVTGKGAFTHVSMYQADIAIADVLTPGEGPTADYRAVGRVTFTDPEIGSVGLTEAAARKQGLDVRTATTQLPDSSRGWIHGPGNDGFIKLVADGELLVGATSAGPWGGEVLSMLTLAVHARVPVAVLADMHYAYPTFHRAVLTAVQELARLKPNDPHRMAGRSRLCTVSAEEIRLSVNQTLTVHDATGEALVLESQWAPAMTDLPPRHWHPSQTEVFEILEGELTIEIADAPARTFSVGERLELAPRTAHRMWNAGSVPARARWTITPARRTKEMFTHIARGRSVLRDLQLIATFRDEYRIGSPRG